MFAKLIYAKQHGEVKNCLEFEPEKIEKKLQKSVAQVAETRLRGLLRFGAMRIS